VFLVRRPGIIYKIFSFLQSPNKFLFFLSTAIKWDEDIFTSFPFYQAESVAFHAKEPCKGAVIDREDAETCFSRVLQEREFDPFFIFRFCQYQEESPYGPIFLFVNADNRLVLTAI